MRQDYPLAIAIPARNEAALAERCLNAIAHQVGFDSDDLAVVFLANNCSDNTAEIVQGLDLPFFIHVKDVTLPRDQAHAGGARRMAMAEAAKLAPSGLVMTTDADCMPDENWIASMMQEFRAGADAVAGRVSGDWDELQHQPASALVLGALEWDYLKLIAEVSHRLDPLNHDPWPRHVQRCGANLGIRTEILQAVGGVPPLPTGEDRALFVAVERRDGLIRHACAPHVTASARTEGRASGGMADTLRVRAAGHYWCDELLEPAQDLIHRCRLRHRARASWMNGDFDHFLALNKLVLTISTDYFGEAWMDLEANHSHLQKKRVQSQTLTKNVEILTQFLSATRHA
jgi:Glycosyl transferase family 2